MRTALLIILSLLSLPRGNAYSQGTCSSGLKIETPAVPKPSHPGFGAATCSTLVVKWKGNIDQTYEVHGTVKDAATHQPIETIPASTYTCDGAFNCTASIPVVAGTTVTWSVQALQLINGSTYYSYPLRSAEDYFIPACEDAAVVAKSTTEEVLEPASEEDNNSAWQMFPNPVESLLHVRLAGASPTNVIRISDLIGRTVLAKPGTAENLQQLDVSHLQKGLYFIRVEDSNGKALHHAKFIKR